MSYPEAITWLAKRYHIEIEETEQSREAIENRQAEESLRIVNSFATTYFQHQLMQTDEGEAIGLSYFKERGFREATIKKFQLGYATDDRDEFTKKAIDKKFNIEHLRTLGLSTSLM